jgi:hypothetical protein
MPIQYCNEHARLFDQKKNLWRDFSRDTMSRVKDVYDYIGTVAFQIVEAPCDRCLEVARHALRRQFNKVDPPQ